MSLLEFPARPLFKCALHAGTKLGASATTAEEVCSPSLTFSAVQTEQLLKLSYRGIQRIKNQENMSSQGTKTGTSDTKVQLLTANRWEEK